MILLLFKYCIDKGKVPTQRLNLCGENLGIWYRNKKVSCSIGDDWYNKLTQNPFVKEDFDRFFRENR